MEFHTKMQSSNAYTGQIARPFSLLVQSNPLIFPWLEKVKLLFKAFPDFHIDWDTKRRRYPYRRHLAQEIFTHMTTDIAYLTDDNWHCLPHIWQLTLPTPQMTTDIAYLTYDNWHCLPHRWQLTLPTSHMTTDTAYLTYDVVHYVPGL